MKINNREISEHCKPFVIAEMSGNHNGNIKQAIEIIKAAKKAGADAVKLQTYTADTITLNSKEKDFEINEGLWAGRTLYDLYEWAHTPWEWHRELFNFAHSLGLTIFSTPFDNSAVDFLEDLNTPAYKIASFESVDLNLIRYVAETRKPMIISTGMANADDIQEAVDVAQASGCKELALLHCVSGYPAPAADYNLRTLSDMRERFGTIVGLSDHTLSNATAIASVALGASLVEKHFTLNRKGGGPDDSFSLEPEELTSLCLDIEAAWKAMGTVNYEIKSSEADNIKFRRSLYFVQDLKAGDLVTKDSVRSVRPGYGLLPKHLDSIVGRRLAQDVRIGVATNWSQFED